MPHSSATTSEGPLTATASVTTDGEPGDTAAAVNGNGGGGGNPRSTGGVSGAGGGSGVDPENGDPPPGVYDILRI